MKKAVVPGTFDPVTKGHMDIIQRAASIFDEVYVVIFDNSSKTTMFSLEQRTQMLQDACDGLKNVKVDTSDDLLIRYVALKGIDVIVRGVRNVRDFDYEYELAQIYRTIGNNIETIFLPSYGENSCISSTMVRELLRYGVDASEYVPVKKNK